MLIGRTVPASVLTDPSADPAVMHVAANFAADLERVSGRRPRRLTTPVGAGGPIVLIAVLGQSALADQLIKAGKIQVSGLAGEWEAYRHFIVNDPFPGVAQALAVIGSDRRGAVFGTYRLSEQMGVSPWYWFADVPVFRRLDVSVAAMPTVEKPKVRYRGFFINDEAPCFSGWSQRKFGGANSAMYAHVFELLLRLGGNYLWPAMWAPRAFAADDHQNQVLADAMGVVMGSSHHEVMTRAQDEWHRHTDQGVTGGPWDYTRNAANLRTFWRGGLERMMSKGDGKGYESVVTVGMRGDGDEAMAAGTATGLLEQIVADQRAIIAEITKRPASDTPQVWALYKEVQDYYDRGMKVPEDVVLLFSDDNWGQVRRLPPLGAAPHKGGYGIYYHFDYVGVPRNYKWLNTNQIEKVWQQMDLAYRRGADAMWIVNVGDIKPMEYPLQFFLKMAWNPEAFTPETLARYPTAWATATLGTNQAEAIGSLITRYSQYTARRKPELINQESFPLGGVTPHGLDGGEFGEMVEQWNALEKDMVSVRTGLSADQGDAYYQLIEHPIAAMANLYRLYYGAAWNKLLAASNDPRANFFATQVETCFAEDQALTARYHAINSGKWDGMMAQVHMSYVIWNDPTQQTMPSITRVGGDTPADRRGLKPVFVDPQPVPAGVIAIEATSFSRSRNGAGLQWARVKHLSRTGDAMLALPQGLPPTTAADQVCLEYTCDVRVAGPATLTVYLAPSLDTSGGAGVRIGVSLNDGPVRVLRAELQATGGAQDSSAKRRWAEAVRDNVVRLSADLGSVSVGNYVVKIWRIDDNVVLQGLSLSTTALAPSYLGLSASAQ